MWMMNWAPDVNVAATGTGTWYMESDVIYDSVSGWIQGEAKDRHQLGLIDADVTNGNIKIEICQSGVTGVGYDEAAHIYSPGATQTIQCPILQVTKPEAVIKITATGTTAWHIRAQGNFRIHA